MLIWKHDKFNRTIEKFVTMSKDTKSRSKTAFLRGLNFL